MSSAGNTSSSIDEVPACDAEPSVATEWSATRVVGFAGELAEPAGLTGIFEGGVFDDGWSFAYGSSSSGMILVGGVAGIPFGGTRWP